MMQKLDLLPDQPDDVYGLSYTLRAWPTRSGYAAEPPWSRILHADYCPSLNTGTFSSDFIAYGHFHYISPSDGFVRWFVWGKDSSGLRIYRVTATGSGGRFQITNYSPGGTFLTVTVPSNRAPHGFVCANYGAVMLAVCDQISASGGVYLWDGAASALALISTSPNARTIEVFKNFAVVGNINNTFGGGIVGARNMLAWSDQGNYNTWTPATGVQANWMQLNDQSGEIVALKRLGDYLIVYCTDAIYRLQYIGGAYTFRAEKLVDGIGCDNDSYGPSVISLGSFHVFSHRNEVYAFDGTRPQSMTKNRIAALLASTPLLPDSYNDVGATNYDMRGVEFIHHREREVIEVGANRFAYNYVGDRWAHIGGTLLNMGNTDAAAVAPSRKSGVSSGDSTVNWAPLSSTMTYANGYTAVFPYSEVLFGKGASGSALLEMSRRPGYGIPSSANYFSTWGVTLKSVALEGGARQSMLRTLTVLPSDGAIWSAGNLLAHIGSEGMHSSGASATTSNIVWDGPRVRFAPNKIARWHKCGLTFVAGYSTETWNANHDPGSVPFGGYRAELTAQGKEF